MSVSRLSADGADDVTDVRMCSLVDVPFVPVASYKDPASVVKEYYTAA